MHLLLKNCGSSEPKPTATITEIPEGKETPAEADAEEKHGSTSDIIPLATRTKEGMAALVKILKGLPGRAAGHHGPYPHGRGIFATTVTLCVFLHVKVLTFILQSAPCHVMHGSLCC